jgi:FlgD Ig-like domain/FG-GAP-like repeat/FG-GAP repeat
MPRPLLLLSLFALFSLHASAAIARIDDCGPVDTVEVIRNGSIANGQFGRSVALVDVNGDGYLDLLVGSPALDQVDLYLATQTPLGSPLQTVPSWTFHGAAGSLTGLCVSRVGDVDGDGIEDFAVGAPLYVPPASTGEGAVFVFRGRPSGPSTTPFATVVGLTNSNFGAAVCGGDLDGDGKSEVVVGAPADGGIGSIYVYRSSSGVLIPCSSKIGPTAGSQFGTSVALSDMDGDGRLDLAVGAPGAGDGSIQIYAGVGFPNFLAPTFVTITGDQANAQFGAALAAGANFDGDAANRQDLLVGEPLCTTGAGVQAGRVFLVPGTATLASGSTWSVDGDQSGGRFGSQVAIADLTGDGRPDVLVSAPFAGVGGRVWVFPSQAASLPATTPSYHFDGESGSRFGLGLASGGWLNPSAREQFVVGAPLCTVPPGLTVGTACAFVTNPSCAAAVPGEPNPSDVALEIVGANPFRTNAHVAFTLPHESTVQLRVLDITGRVVQTLTDGVMQAGRTEASWNGHAATGKAAPAGVYFVEMRVGGETRSVRFVKMI